MSVYTSYYSKASRELSPMNSIFVSISNSTPKWFPYETIKLSEVEPTWDIINKWKSSSKTEEDWCEYTNDYMEYISGYRLNKFENDLNNLIASTDKDIILLCYEKPSDKCHRHIIGKLLNIKEYGV